MRYRIISVLEGKNERLNNLSKGTQLLQLLSDEAKIQNQVYLQSVIFLLILGAFLEDIK